MKQQEFKAPEGLPKPLGQRVLVKEIQQEETKTAGGIIIGAGVKQLQDCGIGVLMAIGSTSALDIKPGERVAFDKRSNMVVYHKGIPYLHMMDYELYCSYGDDTRFESKVADNEELRREKRSNTAKAITEDTNERVDKLQNQDEMPKSKVIIMPK